MVIVLSNEALLEEFLVQHEIDSALVVTKHERKALSEQLGIEVLSAGEFYLIVDPPVGNYDGLYGWLWVDGALVELNGPNVLPNTSG